MAIPDATNIRRCDDTMWSHQLTNHSSGFTEVRVITPSFSDTSHAFQLAASVINFLVGTLPPHPLWNPSYQKIEFTGAGPLQATPLEGKWLVENITESWYLEQLKNPLAAFSAGAVTSGRSPLVTVPTPTGVMRTVTIWNVFSASWGTTLTRWPGASHIVNSVRNATENYQNANASVVLMPPFPIIPITNTRNGVADLLQNGCFQDPFTVLASLALQQRETHFVSEKAIQGDYVFILENGRISLIRSDPAIRVARALEITAAKDFYVRYVREVYGDTAVSRARLNLGLSLRGLEAVCPDHVFKFNMASQFVLNMLHITNFLTKLKMPANPQLALDLSSWANFHASFLIGGVPLALKPLRGLYEHALRKFPGQAAITFLQLSANFTDGGGIVRRVKDLSLQSCDDLLRIALYGFDLNTPAMNQEFFTGRKIEHLAICGYKTMGNRDEYDATRNWFEALHIYPLLSRGNWGTPQAETAFYELLVHVLVKKSLLDVDPQAAQKRCTGRFIPAPMLDDFRTWYSITAFVNDGGGDINYILRPVSSCAQMNGKRLPFIKLFRSTASDKEAEDHQDSINADLNISGIGSLDENGGDSYEEKDFFRCTLPLWMGYLIQGNIPAAQQAFNRYPPIRGLLNGHFPTENEEKSVGEETEVIACLVRLSGISQAEAETRWNEFRDLITPEQVKVLLELSSNRDEWMPELKEIKQDVIFMGHSLGGALAQQSMVHFLVDKGRIPLPGCSYRCICFDSPGTTMRKSAMFTQFTTDHAALFTALNLRIDFSFYFEKKDTVAQGGEIFLGTTLADRGHTIDINNPPPGRFLTFNAEVREANFDVATAKELTTLSIHGKRFAYTGGDAITTMITAETLENLKRNWKPSSTSMTQLGWNTPAWIIDSTRKTAGGVIAPYLWIKNKIYGPEVAPVDVTRVQEFV